MEALQALTSQLHFSLSMSQMIITFGILALGAIWGRMKAGVFFSLSTFAYWEYAANKAVLFEMAVANAYGIFMTLFVGLFLGFLLVYTWVAPSSSR
jgi:hypothetical protein